MDFNERMDQYVDMLDNSIMKVMVRPSDIYHRVLYDSMDYSLFTGGKRIRPILCLEACRVFSGSPDKAIAYAVAIEMIHTYSLVHDDLPSMDNDDYRRGQLTNHKEFGEDIAILAGDGLLNSAYEASLATIMAYESLEDRNRGIEALYEISKYSGADGMIAGQVVDVRTESKNFDQARLIYMYENKTAGLIRGGLVAGAIMGGASREEIEIIRKFGFNLGLAYQIQDDLLDLDEDIIIDKPTYPALLGEERAKEAMEFYSKEALSLLKSLNNENTNFLEDLTLKLVDRQV